MKKASEVVDFPYGWPGIVAYFTVADGEVIQLAGRGSLRQALTDKFEIYAAWPGRWSTDIFAIDRPELLAEAIGHPL